MAKPHHWVGSMPFDLIGQPFIPGRGSTPGITIIQENEPMAQKKAPADGTYILNGVPYVTRKGAIMPDGAEFEGGPLPGSDEEADQQEDVRARGAAPENRAKAEKPEKR